MEGNERRAYLLPAKPVGRHLTRTASGRLFDASDRSPRSTMNSTPGLIAGMRAKSRCSTPPRKKGRLSWPIACETSRDDAVQPVAADNSHHCSSTSDHVRGIDSASAGGYLIIYTTERK